MQRKRIFPEMPDFMANLSPDEWTTPFWQAASEHRLVAPKCTSCGAFRMPPSPFCWNCRHQDVEWIELSGRGTVYTFVIARQALIPQLQAAMPNVVAVIELDDAPGCRLVGNILEVDFDAVEIGMSVVVAWDDIDDTVTIPRFVPAP
jgi:uncharacterized OB-fold protein